MFNIGISMIISFLVASPAFAQETHIIDNKIEIVLPAGYHPTPKELSSADMGTSFSSPIRKLDIDEALAKYTTGATSEEYLNYMVSNEFGDENNDTEIFKNNL